MSLLFRRFFIALFFGLLVTPAAAFQIPGRPNIDGRNVKEVRVTNRAMSTKPELQTYYKQKADGTWVESSWDGRTVLRETGRDKWSVYLKRVDNGRKVQIDLWKKAVFSDRWRRYEIKDVGITLCSTFNATPTSQKFNTLTFKFTQTAKRNYDWYGDSSSRKLAFEKDNRGRFRFQRPLFRIDRTKKTFILIHGFTSKPTQAFGVKGRYNTGQLNGVNHNYRLSSTNQSLKWGANVHTAITDRYPNANILTVDWSSMSGKDQGAYNWVISRMWQVGWTLADLLEEELCVDPDKTEIIGHSLGAHIAGTTGYDYNKNTKKKIKRIVGLDAAGVLVSRYGKDVLLNKGDAKKVVGIHTSDARFWAAGTVNQALGWYPEFGDLDIYVYSKYINDDKKGQLLGSGHGDWRNNHGYAVRLYRDLLSGGKFKSASKWTWNESDFTADFDLASLDTVTGTNTIFHNFVFRTNQWWGSRVIP